MQSRGEEIHGEAHSTNASGSVAISYTDGGVARTILSTEVVMITDFTIVSVAGGDIQLYATLGSDQIQLFRGTVVANGGASRNLCTPFEVPHGWALKVIAPSGVVDVQVEGYVIH